MIREVFEKAITIFMVTRGYAPYYALQVWQDRWDDFMNNKNTSFRQKIWAQRRGFLSDRIAIYGLNDENYRDYLSDFGYKKIYPINGAYSAWIDDKITIRYLLQPFKEYLPEYFYQINKGKILYLPDCPPGYDDSPEGILDLLQDRKELALKLVEGSKGKGFYKLSVADDNYYINGTLVPQAEVRNLLLSLHGYIITEYITAHADIRRMYDGALNTLRVLVINKNGDNSIFANAYLRIGTSQSGVVDNTSAGGLCALVDIETGKISNLIEFIDYGIKSWEVHPDTGEAVKGVLPNLELIKSKLKEISQYVPQIRHMGYDIAVTGDSFKILEINSHPGILCQYYYPLLRDNDCRKFFENLIKLK